MQLPNGPKILITGGAGFIGSQLGHHLAGEGHEVVLLDNMSFGHLDNLVIEGRTFGTLLVRDVRDQNLSLLMQGVDTVFHFAGIAPLPVCQAEPHLAFEVNTAAAGNVLEAARRAGVRRVVFSSTSAVYENTDTEKHAESDPVKPDLTYAMTKWAAEQICRSYADNYGCDIIIARFFNVYGSHQDCQRQSPPFTSYIARELAAGRAPRLFNRSAIRRDYVYVTDVIDLLCRMMTSKKPYAAEIYNIGSGESYSVPELYEKMRAISGKQIDAHYADPHAYWDSYTDLFAGSHPMRRERIAREVHKSALADTRKSAREFSWTTRVSIDEGLRAVYDYAVRHTAPSSAQRLTAGHVNGHVVR